MKHKFNLTIIILLIWQLIATTINKEVIVPFPIHVFFKMISMLGDISFYQTLFITLSHVIIVVIISAYLAFGLSYLGFRIPMIDEYISPIITILQSIPNISFIILVLVWTSSLNTVYIVLFLVIFPLLYQNFIEGFKSIDTDLIDVILLYHPPLFEKLFKIYLPLIQPSFISGIKSSLNLGVKVTVMAEILAGLPYGIGRSLNYYRIQFDMVGVFAWTIWLVIMILIINAILNKTTK